MDAERELLKALGEIQNTLNNIKWILMCVFVLMLVGVWHFG